QGGITAGDTPGYPATITKAGRYKLTSSLYPPLGKDAIHIQADNVTIDFNGFVVDGRGKGNAGVTTSPATIKGVVLRNGTLTGFKSDGFASHMGSLHVIEDMLISSNGGHGLDLGQNIRVLRSTIAGNAGIGIVCLSACLIEDNVVTDNGLDGIDIG